MVSELPCKQTPVINLRHSSIEKKLLSAYKDLIKIEYLYDSHHAHLL